METNSHRVQVEVGMTVTWRDGDFGMRGRVAEIDDSTVTVRTVDDRGAHFVEIDRDVIRGAWWQS